MQQQHCPKAFRLYIFILFLIFFKYYFILTFLLQFYALYLLQNMHDNLLLLFVLEKDFILIDFCLTRFLTEGSSWGGRFGSLSHKDNR